MTGRKFLWAASRLWYAFRMAHKASKRTRESYNIQIGFRGRIVLPAPVRHKLGLQEGDRMVLFVQPDHSLRLVSLQQELRRLQGIYKQVAPGRSLSEELVEERRQEVRQEES